MIELTGKKEIRIEDKTGTSQVVVYNGTIYNRIELSDGNKYFDRYEGEQTDIFVHARMLNNDSVEYRFYCVRGEMIATKYLIDYTKKLMLERDDCVLSVNWSFICKITKMEEKIRNHFIDSSNSRKAVISNRPSYSHRELFIVEGDVPTPWKR